MLTQADKFDTSDLAVVGASLRLHAHTPTSWHLDPDRNDDTPVNIIAITLAAEESKNSRAVADPIYPA